MASDAPHPWPDALCIFISSQCDSCLSASMDRLTNKRQLCTFASIGRYGFPCAIETAQARGEMCDYARVLIATDAQAASLIEDAASEQGFNSRRDDGNMPAIREQPRQV
jgi:hypothetical protein